MQLTKAQKQSLAFYARYRTLPPTFWFLISRNLVRYLILFVLILFLVVIAPYTFIEPIRWVAIGVFFGVILRDIGLFWRAVNIWPMTAAVLDWERVDQLLAESNMAATEKKGG